MRRFAQVFSTLALLLGVSACATTPPPPPEPEPVKVETPAEAWVRERTSAIVELRKNPHLSITELNDGNVLIQIRSGNTYRSGGIEFGEATRPVFDHVATSVAPYERIALHLIGHSDVKGKDAFKQALSLQRAEAVRDYLVKQGLAPRVLTAEGRGDAEPLVNGKSAEIHAINRRVDILLHPAEPAPEPTVAVAPAAQTPPTSGSAQ